jgi:hypothetical protein
VPAKHQKLISEKLKGKPGFEYREVSGWQHFMGSEAPPILEAALSFVPE